MRQFLNGQWQNGALVYRFEPRNRNAPLFRAPKQTPDPLLQIIRIISPGQQCPRLFQNRHVPSAANPNTPAKLRL